ncbi:MAG TPA: sugar phosphate isomerase/epimerase [Clostridiales bacterium]|jgi:sugar phosphate isomerase/epimerase|nr:sugar phosphate isomerase/epimerase [Clostridiales bacterium]HRT82943.1 sugar phosphate isomerase/epimerase [Oscillospiraceae bacterium]
MKIGIVTDELSLNLPFALGASAALGIKRIELRNSHMGRVPFWDDESKEMLQDLIDDYEFKITALSPGTFKCKLQNPDLDEQFKTLEKTIEFAKEFEVEKIIIFAFEQTEDDGPSGYEKVLDYVGRAALLGQKNGIIIAAENEKGGYNDSFENILKLHNDLASTGLKLNWDPGNYHAACGLPYKQAYEGLKNHIANVHVKDSKGQGKEHAWKALGEGEIDWQGQINDLFGDMPDVDLTIETHAWPLLENSVKNLNMLKEYIGRAKNGR